MPYRFLVRRHPLGVIVYPEPGTTGELLIPGEHCCGISFEQLERIADTTGTVTVDEAAACNCPLKSRKAAA